LRIADLVMRARLAVTPALTEATIVPLNRQLLERSPFLRYRIPAGLTRRADRVGGVDGEWIAREGARRDRVLLYLHGGGYFGGSPRSHRGITTTLAQQLDASVFVPDYRLAPESPFPAALDDAVAVFHALAVPGTRVVVAGDSAGGGLTLALASLVQGHARTPAALYLLSPWTDLALTGASLRTNERRDALFRYDFFPLAAGLYLRGADARDPRASPVFAPITGLPPTLIQVGSGEMLFDDSARVADRLREAGVSAQLDAWTDAPHVFQMVPHLLPESREALAVGARFLQQALDDVTRS
jgi:acetyl esterase/lipase